MNKLDVTLSVYGEHNLFLENDSANFFNHGFLPADKRVENEIFKHQKTLYLHLFDGIETEGKSLLDVGCGRGGGVDTLNKHFNFSSVDACDVTPENIEFCNRFYDDSLTFKLLNAERLDYSDNSFDIVTNVESAHSYDNFSKFLSEIKRVLKPNGLFLFTDLYCAISHIHVDIEGKHTDYESIKNGFKEFTILNELDITENVKQSCLTDSFLFNNYYNTKITKETYSNIAQDKFITYESGINKYITIIAKNKKEDLLV